MEASLARKEKRTLHAIHANGGGSNSQPGRVYQMHFVKLSGLTARARYHYTVSSGGKGAVTSELFSFAAPYSDGVTRVAIFGDMGVYTYNNMGNLYDDVTAGTVDMIVHVSFRLSSVNSIVPPPTLVLLDILRVVAPADYSSALTFARDT
jgi:hypothetical protein